MKISTNTNTINGALFSRMLRSGAATLDANRQLVNELNVFPIPDGDTGDNMSMTMASGVAALDEENSGSLAAAASQAAKGMLFGARGNSGVILSRIFAGFSSGLNGASEADVRVLGKAFESGVDEAYRAVSVPVEGTILTVYKDAVAYAGKRIGNDSTIESYFDHFLVELRRSLERTPELLPVLAKAGVVDSGGAGFIYIAEGMKKALEDTGASPQYLPEEKKNTLDLSLFDENSELTYGYCTEFLLRLQNSKKGPERFNIEEARKWLDSIGDSVVLFQEGTVIKGHVHTKAPGDVLNYGQQFGEFLTTKIENMTLQHNETHRHDIERSALKKPRKSCGIVSVAAGNGLRELFYSLGCDVVVDGGQCMNPSAEDLIVAFSRVNASRIYVYPNNSNILMTAQQAASLYKEAEICIIPSKTIGEGYAAISMLDTDNPDAQAVIEEQKEIISGIITGAVSQAVRDTEQDGIMVHKNEFIGFVGDTIYNSLPSRNEALISLAQALYAGNYDIAIVCCGEGVSAAESEEIYSRLSADFKKTEIIIIDGQQPVYDYFLILE